MEVSVDVEGEGKVLEVEPIQKFNFELSKELESVSVSHVKCKTGYVPSCFNLPYLGLLTLGKFKTREHLYSYKGYI